MYLKCVAGGVDCAKGETVCVNSDVWTWYHACLYPLCSHCRPPRYLCRPPRRFCRHLRCFVRLRYSVRLRCFVHPHCFVRPPRLRPRPRPPRLAIVVHVVTLAKAVGPFEPEGDVQRRVFVYVVVCV